MDAPLIVVNPFLHPDLVLYPAPGTALVPDRLLPAYAQDMRVGAGAYTGAMAHHLGCPVEYLDRVGRDVFGSFTMAELRRLGHGVTHVRRFDGDHMVCVSVADSRSAGGTMVASYPEAWRCTVDDLAALLADAPVGRAMYVYSWFWSFAHPALAGGPTADLLLDAADRGHRLVLDPNWKPAGPPPPPEVDQLRQALAVVDVLAPNRRDAAQLVGEADPATTARRLLDLGPRVVLLKDGAAGCYLAQRDRRGVLRVPAADVPVRDTTGAGDYFGGAYVAHGGPAPAAAAFATAAAGLAISRGADDPLPSREAVDALAGTLLARSEEIA